MPVDRWLTPAENNELCQLKALHPNEVVWGSVNPDTDEFVSHVSDDESVMRLAAIVGFMVVHVQEAL